MRSAIAFAFFVLAGCGQQGTDTGPVAVETGPGAKPPVVDSGGPVADAADAELPAAGTPQSAAAGKEVAIDIVGITTLYQEGKMMTAIVPNSGHAGHEAMLLVPPRFLAAEVRGSTRQQHRGEEYVFIPLMGEEILVDVAVTPGGEAPTLQFSTDGTGPCPDEKTLTSLRWVPLLSEVTNREVEPKPEFVKADPDAKLVAARMPMRSGQLATIIGEPNVWTFKARGAETPRDAHRQFMAEGVKYTFPRAEGRFTLTLRKFGTNERRTIVLDAGAEDFLTLKLANLPKGGGEPARAGVIDEHFALYYSMVADDVPRMLPHLDAKACDIGSGIDGVNCGPDRLVSKNQP